MAKSKRSENSVPPPASTLKKKRKVSHGPLRSPERTKAQLLQAARQLFAKQGLYGTSVQEIAKAAKANVSLISHYFGGKEGLYQACIEDFGEARLKVLERMLEAPQTKEEFRLRLQMFINELLDFHLENYEVTTILLRDVMFDSHLWGKKSQSTLFLFVSRLVDYLNEAKEKGFVSEKTDPTNAAGIIYLAFLALFQVNHIAEKRLNVSITDRDLRQQIVKQTLDTIWYGIRPD